MQGCIAREGSTGAAAGQRAPQFERGERAGRCYRLNRSTGEREHAVRPSVPRFAGSSGEKRCSVLSQKFAISPASSSRRRSGPNSGHRYRPSRPCENSVIAVLGPPFPSFPRKRESKDFSRLPHFMPGQAWIPAFAGMTILDDRQVSSQPASPVGREDNRGESNPTNLRTRLLELFIPPALRVLLDPRRRLTNRQYERVCGSSAGHDARPAER